jgi:ABC-type dipeptide/oligopeptide/nickel transport system ATPase component
MSTHRLISIEAGVGIRILGSDLLVLLPASMNLLRGRAMVRIPQKPHGSLNPVFRAGRQVADCIQIPAGCRFHPRGGRADAQTATASAIAAIDIVFSLPIMARFSLGLGCTFWVR